MTILLSKQQRDQIGLSSWERAITWSALMLRATNVDPERKEKNPNYKYTNAVRIAISRSLVNGEVKGFINLEGNFPYLSFSSLKSSGDYLAHLLPFIEGEGIDFIGQTCPYLEGQGFTTSGGGDGLPNEPTSIITLEQYFVWACYQKEKELLASNPSQDYPLKITPQEEATGGPIVQVEVTIPIDLGIYRTLNNLVCSVLFITAENSGGGGGGGGTTLNWENITNKPDFTDFFDPFTYSDPIANPPQAGEGLIYNGSQITFGQVSAQPGQDGLDGTNAYSVITAGFVVPPENATVQIEIDQVNWVSEGLIIYIETAGYYQVNSVDSSVDLTLQNLGYTGNAEAGTAISINAIVAAAGPKGEDGIDGSPGPAGTVDATSGVKLDQQSTPPTAEAGKTIIYADDVGKINLVKPNSSEVELLQNILTAKGDLLVFDGTDYVKLAAGNDGEVLQADSSQPLGLIWASPIARRKATEDINYYIAPEGNDNNDGMSAGTPFLTIQKAIDSLANWDCSYHNGYINIAAGTYTQTAPIILRTIIGSGVYCLLGAGDTSVITSTQELTTTDGFNCLIGANDSRSIWTLKNFKVTTTASSGVVFLIHASSGSQIKIDGLNFGAATSGAITQHVRIEDGGRIKFINNYSISGGAHYHFGLAGGTIRSQNQTISINSSPNFSASFIDANVGSTCLINGCTFSGSASGKRYNIAKYGIIQAGTISETYLPGSITGTIVNGQGYYGT